MDSADLEGVRQVIREELRRCGLRPVLPLGPGAWIWNAERDEWVVVLPVPESALMP